MADFDSTRFSDTRNALAQTSDDSNFVYEALHILGFCNVAFCDLSTTEMRDVLAVALYLKVKQANEARAVEAWES